MKKTAAAVAALLVCATATADLAETVMTGGGWFAYAQQGAWTISLSSRTCPSPKLGGWKIALFDGHLIAPACWRPHPKSRGSIEICSVYEDDAGAVAPGKCTGVPMDSFIDTASLPRRAF